MTPPGDRLRTIAARLLSDRTMERLIDPVLTDVQIEDQSAIAHGRVWRSRWIRLAGYVALFKALGNVVDLSSLSEDHRGGREDRRVRLVPGIVALIDRQ